MAARPFPPSLGATYWTAGDGQWSPEPSANEVVSPANWQPSIDGRSHTQVASEDVLAADLSALPSVLSASQPSYAPLPTEAEQRALATLKDYPDYVLVAWFNSARRWPAGLPPNFMTSQPYLLQPDSIPTLFQQLAEDNPLHYRASVSPWNVPARRVSGLEQEAQRPPSTPSRLHPPSEVSSSPGSGGLISGYTSVDSLTSAPHRTSQRPSTSGNVVPQFGAKTGAKIDELSRSASGHSLGAFSESNIPSQSPTPKRQTDSAMYSCTFCSSPSTFRSKHEWKRHERSHVPQVEYTCLPKGAIIAFGGLPVCAICGIKEPRADHLVEHKMHLCLHKPTEDRTYFRKDKFANHLRVHGLSLESTQVAHWCQPLHERVLGCGFCVHYFDRFEERSQHVASHFEQGYRKDSWNRSTVILSLLAQPFVTLHWLSLQESASRMASNAYISWPESSSTDVLQRRLEDGSEDGLDLAVAAYNLSSICSGEREKIKSKPIPEHPANSLGHDAGPFNLFQ